ncbi:MAG: hypothetical protein GF328_14105, partial [Candidatus Latescibacteria bacterium]|nr:hypothetical protein [Candidatus Latescibacterota bacterium]
RMRSRTSCAHTAIGASGQPSDGIYRGGSRTSSWTRQSWETSRSTGLGPGSTWFPDSGEGCWPRTGTSSSPHICIGVPAPTMVLLMMAVIMDRDRISALSAETGFPPGPLEKVIRLGEVAASVARHPLLSRVLALKGGTALNLFGGPPPRLSVDLDFNYIGTLDREAMLRARPDVERAVEAFAGELKYEIQRSRDEFAGRKLFLNYVSVSGSPDRIEIDLNFLQRLPLAPPRRATMWQPGDLGRPEVQLCGLPEIAAGKICALLDRCKPRDMFDVIRLPEAGASFWSSEFFKKLVIAFTGTLDHPLHAYGRDRMERVRGIDIEAELVPMLGGQTKIDRVDLIGHAWKAVERLLVLDESEREFVDRLQVGDLRLDLLVPEDAELRERLGKWPPLQWKVLNARKSRPAPRRDPGAAGDP